MLCGCYHRLMGGRKDTSPTPSTASKHSGFYKCTGSIQSYLGRSKRLQQYNEMFPEELCKEKSQEKKFYLIRRYLSSQGKKRGAKQR